MFILFNRKKRHFLGKLWNLQRQIWDYEFKKFASQQLRESIRLDRDRKAEHCDALKLEIEKEHKPETKKVLEENLAKGLEDVKRFEAQMNMLDVEINGLPYQSSENPGRQGVNDNLSALAESKKMVEHYLKTL